MLASLSGSTESFAGYGAHVSTREAALGLTRVDNGDGTFHYALPAGSTISDQVGDVFTWRYVGQADFPWSPTTVTSVAFADDTPDNGDDPSAGLDSLAGTHMVDELGRLWIAVDVKPVEAWYAIADYWADVDDSFGLEVHPVGSMPPQDLDALSSSGTWTFTSWSFPDCNINGVRDDDFMIWNAESRLPFNAAGSSLGHAEEAVMRVRKPNGGVCGGIRLKEQWVLTAAHCVTKGDGTAFSAAMIEVCSDGGSSRCFSGGSVIQAPHWSGSDTGDSEDDYALVGLTGLATPTDPRMVLSNDTRDDIRRRSLHHVGFPGDVLRSDGSCATVPIAQASLHAATDVRGTRNGMVRLRADTSNGASGGPWYFLDGGVGRVVGVQSGYHDGHLGTGWVGGPRVTEFRHWVIAVLGNRTSP